MDPLSVGPTLRIFMSYRRNDTSAVTGRVSDFLRSRFGPSSVFLDIDEIAYGANIREAIEEAIHAAEIVLVLIGDRWLEGQRLQNRDDYVRMEIEAALATRRMIIPILVDDAAMPNADQVPLSMQALVALNAAHLSFERFHADVDRLIAAIERRSQVPSGVYPTPEKLSHAIAQRTALIFVSYAQEDNYWLNRVKVHLKPLTRRERLELWSRDQAKVGDESRDEIRKALDVCVAAVVLVSADFMASDFMNDELPPLLTDATRRGVKVLPVLVSSSSFEHSDLARFPALNPPSTPLDRMSKGEQEATLAKLDTTIKPLVDVAGQ